MTIIVLLPIGFLLPLEKTSPIVNFRSEKGLVRALSGTDFLGGVHFRESMPLILSRRAGPAVRENALERGIP